MEGNLTRRKRNKPLTSDESSDDQLGLPTEEEIRKMIPQSNFEEMESLKNVPKRWRNWIIRFVIGFILILIFSLIIYSGPVSLIFLVVVLQLLCFHEIISVGYVVYRIHNLPYFRVLSWYFLFAFNYYLHGDVIALFICDRFGLNNLATTFVRHHQLFSFILYLSALLLFINSLIKRHYTKQFTLFGFTHVALVIISFSTFQIQNIFNGLIWFVLPVLTIIVNDISAYFVGFHIGRTPLIKLSPKKTWEGFIGGFVFTLIFSILGARFMIPFDYFICPVDNLSIQPCHRPYSFKEDYYTFPPLFGGNVVSYYPFYMDAVIMGLFASLIAPFGGFFASGFKRAFRLKDFGQILPGHGGFLDRFDCQFLMGAFVYVYYNSFINRSADKVYKIIMHLSPEEQLSIYHNLTHSLTMNGYLSYFVDYFVLVY